MRFSKLFIVSVLIVSAMGCGGGSSITVPPPPPPVPSSISVTVTFIFGIDTVAVQIGSGAFAAQTLQKNPSGLGQLNLTLPSMTSKYAIAWHCVLGVAPNSFGDFVLEATPADGTQYNLGCSLTQPPPPAIGTFLGSGNVDASAIGAVSFISIYGNQARGGISGASGAFSINLFTGINDVAFVPTSVSDILAVKIVRNQTVPGAINGGNPVVIGSNDMTSTQPLTVGSIPAGFSTSPTVVTFQTANGTAVPLAQATTQYPALPQGAVQSGDRYVFTTQVSNATTKQSLGLAQSSTDGGPVTLSAFPQPWSYSGPAPAAFPTFTFNYSGFTGLPVVTEDTRISTVAVDAGEPVFLSLEVLATGSYQNGANTITIPDLSALPVSTHLAGAPSGTLISWSAFITAGSAPEMQFLPNLGANNTVSTVGNSGAYTVP
ncbi:MAG TPA: hypothetical protein VJA94_20645 [Candidatus Angelobacter sp.]